MKKVRAGKGGGNQGQGQASAREQPGRPSQGEKQPEGAGGEGRRGGRARDQEPVGCGWVDRLAGQLDWKAGG